MHSLRVGMYLYQHEYSADVVLGGLLHDILEWTEGSENLLKEEFGERVLAIVKANTKDRSIVDPAERLIDLRYERPFPVLDPEEKVPVRLKRRAVCRVREVLFLFAHPGYDLASAVQQLFELTVEDRPVVLEPILFHNPEV